MANLTLNTKEAICHWLEQMKVKKFTVNDDLTVDVNSSVDLTDNDFISLPVQFGKVIGNFDVSDTSLTSLKGCPKKVMGDLYAEAIPIMNLNDFETVIIGSLHLNGNRKMRSLCTNQSIVASEIYLTGVPLDMSKLTYSNIKKLETKKIVLSDDNKLNTEYKHLSIRKNNQIHLHFAKIKEVLKVQYEKELLEKIISNEKIDKLSKKTKI